VTRAPNGNQQVMFPGEGDGGLHIRHGGALHDDRRTTIDHRVVDAAGSVIAGIRGREQPSANAARKGLH
jgi:hypothetical protein